MNDDEIKEILSNENLQLRSNNEQLQKQIQDLTISLQVLEAMYVENVKLKDKVLKMLYQTRKTIKKKSQNIKQKSHLLEEQNQIIEDQKAVINLEEKVVQDLQRKHNNLLEANTVKEKQIKKLTKRIDLKERFKKITKGLKTSK